jgi:hypothetical protein
LPIADCEIGGGEWVRLWFDFKDEMAIQSGNIFSDKAISFMATKKHPKKRSVGSKSDFVVRVEGPKGETIFSAYPWAASPQTIDELNAKIAWALDHVSKAMDDRLLVLLGAMIVENAVDELLAAIMPGYKVLQQNKDFTFSMKIELARALRLIPSWILGCADIIRSIRNDFAHELSINTFDKIKAAKIASMRDHVLQFNSGLISRNLPEELQAPDGDFVVLVKLTAMTIYSYAADVKTLDDFLRSDGFIKHLARFHKHSLKQVDNQ